MRQRLNGPLWPFWDMRRKAAIGELFFESIPSFRRTKSFLSSFYNLSTTLGSSLFHWQLCDLLQEKDFEDETEEATSKKREQRVSMVDSKPEDRLQKQVM